MKLILASASPRRAEVLRDAGIAFEAVSTNIDESLRPNESPEELVIRLAEAKARSAAARLLPVSGPAIVLGADTEVVADGPGGRQVLGKPASAQDARAMLRRLSGRTHEVITGLFLIHLPGGVTRVEHETTRVTFAPLTTWWEVRDASRGVLLQRGGLAFGAALPPPARARLARVKPRPP